MITWLLWQEREKRCKRKERYIFLKREKETERKGKRESFREIINSKGKRQLHDVKALGKLMDVEL